VKREPERGSRRREEDIGETWPELPEWATAEALDVDVRRDLRGLSKEGADWVAAHLVAAGALADDDPDTAWRHARAARARGGRIGVVRETVGLVAYRAGEWAEAIGELRAARRMGGGPGHLAVMADCERALGHPERAIELSRSVEADQLDPEASTELSIVVSGARADLGQIDAAMAHLERVGLDKAEEHPRLAYAYADLLLTAGRSDEALSWFIRAANADAEEETDALDRVADLSGGDSDGGDSDRSHTVGVGHDPGSATDLADDLEFSPGAAVPGKDNLGADGADRKGNAALEQTDESDETDGADDKPGVHEGGADGGADGADELAAFSDGEAVHVDSNGAGASRDASSVELELAAPDEAALGDAPASDTPRTVDDVREGELADSGPSGGGELADSGPSGGGELADSGPSGDLAGSDEADGDVGVINEPDAAPAGNIDPIAPAADSEPEREPGPKDRDPGIPTVMFSDDPQTGDR